MGSTQERDPQVGSTGLKKASERGSMNTVVLICQLFPPITTSSPLNVAVLVAESKETAKTCVTVDSIKV